jgi:hypothetical protein
MNPDERGLSVFIRGQKVNNGKIANLPYPGLE